MNRKQRKKLEAKQKQVNECKGCPNCCEYVDKYWNRKKLCLAFEYLWMNQKYIDGCPFDEEGE